MFPTHVVRHFKEVEPKLLQRVKNINDLQFMPTKRFFRDLCESIVCQQLSGKAAASIWKRFQTSIGNNNIKPEYILHVDELLLRQTGISWSKTKYIKNIAVAFLDGTVTPKHFSSMSDIEITTQLIQIKGVGKWTAEMFLMFSLGREDVFSAGDLGLRKGVQKLLQMKTLPSIITMNRVSKKWSPYRTYAALYLWSSLEEK